MRRLAHVTIGLISTVVAALAACDLARPIAGGNGCSNCHGSNENAAPPAALDGGTSTVSIAVGAHQSHLHDGKIRKAIACSECHVVPASVGQQGHMGLAPAPVSFATGPGDVARVGGTPAWDRQRATCTVYCHGSTLSGGSNTGPVWTEVGQGQAACGTCHGLPPGGGHPSVTGGAAACSKCHPGTVKPDGTIDVAGGLHIDGQVEVGGAACTSCHGDSSRQATALNPQFPAAPPLDTAGNSATSAHGVGAHQAHLVDGSLRAALACNECHTVPTGTAGHPSGTLDLTWGTLARTGGTSPSYSSGSCSATYCHGATLGAGGTNQTPTWTGGSAQAQCGTCHSIPPPASTGHPSNSNCGGCHPGYTQTSVNPATHIDGKVDVTGLTCTSCHGDASRTAVAGADANVKASPPITATGRSAGAHMAHVDKTGGMMSPAQCAECHSGAVPTSTSSHPSGTIVVAFSGRTTTGSYDSGTLGCASTYCHGNFTNGNNATPKWTDGPMTCSSCHGDPPATGRHADHPGGTQCSLCHSDANAAGTAITNPSLHVNGVIDVRANNLTWDCNACHN